MDGLPVVATTAGARCRRAAPSRPREDPVWYHAPEDPEMPTASSAVQAAIPEELAARLRALGARYGVHDIRVFGSLARGDASPDSDIDLLVNYVPGHGGFAFVEFCEEVERLLGRRVDVVSERSLHPRVRERILLQAVLL
jgi:predicted nucleotidyltransferase